MISAEGRVAENLVSQVTTRGNADYRFFFAFRFFAEAAAAARPPPSPPFSAMRFESAFSRGFRRFRRAQPQIEPLSICAEIKFTARPS